MYEQVAAKVNLNPRMTQKVTWKTVQDLYNRLQDDLDADDARNVGLFGVTGGEMGELYPALPQMREEKESFVKKKNAVKKEKNKKDEEKERLGREVVQMALLRKSQRTSPEDRSDDGSAEGNESLIGEEGSSRKKKRRKVVQSIDLAGGLALFADKLKEADLAGIALESEHLNFEKEKYEMEREERGKDHEECRKEREDAQKVELEKFKIMFDVFKQNKN